MQQTSKRTITVGLAIDNVILRKGFEEIIRSFEGCKPIIVENFTHFVEKLYLSDVPDLCLLDVNIHQPETIRMIKQLRAEFPLMKIIVLSNFDHPFNIIQSFRNGTQGHISKDISSSQLHCALLSVYYTGQYYDETLFDKKPDMLKDQGKVVLTELESKLLALFCTELTYKEIATLLDLNLQIIEGYRDVLFEKLNVQSRIGLTVSAYKMGIASAPENDNLTIDKSLYN